MTHPCPTVYITLPSSLKLLYRTVRVQYINNLCRLGRAPLASIVTIRHTLPANRHEDIVLATTVSISLSQRDTNNGKQKKSSP